MSGRWRRWRCSRGRHRHVEAHPAIWNGSYVQCQDCAARDVHGGDRYGPAAIPWIASGRVPPGRGALVWGSEQWIEWRADR